ncbi:MAG TPA: hypothetical protein VET90_02705 [Candidatus Binatus sp.]|nr:hypothetical protein [Candidatus Binatus sp.]
MDHDPSVLRVPAPPRGGWSAVVVIGAVLVGLAILKPWALTAGSGPGTALASLAAADRSPAGTPRSGTSAAPSAGLAVAIGDPNAMACMSSEGNRVLALSREPGLEVRTWLTVDDLSLTNPLDPAAVPLRLLSANVIGLGICAQRVNQDAVLSSAASIVEVARIESPSTATGPASPNLVDLGVPRVITQQLGDPTMGILYGPPSEALVPGIASRPSANPALEPNRSSAATWSVGEYAIEFTLPGDPAGSVRWLRLDVVPSVGQYG